MATELLPGLEQEAAYLRTMLVRSKQNIVDIGLKLIEVRSHFKRTKDFYEWTQAECAISSSTTDNFMHAAAFAQKFPSLGNLDPWVMYELAAPKTPPEVIDAVVSGQVEATFPAIREAKRILKGDPPAQVSSSAAQWFSACLNLKTDYPDRTDRR